jgi:hypothetical protein
MERAIYVYAMDHLTLATVILDASGHVIHMNALAREILHRQDGIVLANDTLALTHPADAQRLRDAINRAISVSRAAKPGIVDVLRARRPSGAGHYGIMIRPAAGSVEAEQQAWPGGGRIHQRREGAQTPAQSRPSAALRLTHRGAAGAVPRQRTQPAGSGRRSGHHAQYRAHLRSTFSKPALIGRRAWCAPAQKRRQLGGQPPTPRYGFSARTSKRSK